MEIDTEVLKQFLAKMNREQLEAYVVYLEGCHSKCLKELVAVKQR